MASDKIIRSLSQFRSKFVIPPGRLGGSNVGKWFPTHMYVSLKQMQAKLRSVDCVVEVHDARIPFSGRNEQFRNLLYSIRPHILVLNKCDLIDAKLQTRIEFQLREKEKNLSHILWTNCKLKQQSSIKRLTSAIYESIENVPRFNREARTHYMLMVIGIPNVGKSSLVNAIRHVCSGLSQPAKVGPTPGVTQAVQEKVRIRSSPLIYMLDTPGILAPNIRDTDVAMKVALCETVLQHRVGYDLMADYLLYRMNKRGDFQYLELTNLKEPTDDITKLQFEIAFKQELFRKTKSIEDNGATLALDLEGACQFFLNHFRKGKFGCQFLDGEYLENT